MNNRMALLAVYTDWQKKLLESIATRYETTE